MLDSDDPDVRRRAKRSASAKSANLAELRMLRLASAPPTPAQEAHDRLCRLLPRCGFVKAEDGHFYRWASAGQSIRIMLRPHIVIVQGRHPQRQWVRIDSSPLLKLDFRAYSVYIGDYLFSQEDV